MSMTQQMTNVDGTELPSTRSSAAGVPLWPKEHGAYAVLAVPIVTAFIVSGTTLIGVCVAVASAAGFFAHEPLLVAWGHRGRRAQTATPAAKSRSIALLAVTCIAGCTAMFVSTPVIRVSLVVCFLLAVIGFRLAIIGKHRAAASQLWGVMVLSAPSVPIMLAGTLSLSDAVTIWATWLLGFSATTFAVHSVIAAQKRQRRALYFLIVTSISTATLISIMLQVRYIAAIVPMILASWYLLLWPPPAKYLKRVGWILVVATLTTAVLLVTLK